MLKWLMVMVMMVSHGGTDRLVDAETPIQTAVPDVGGGRPGRGGAGLERPRSSRRSGAIDGRRRPREIGSVAAPRLRVREERRRVAFTPTSRSVFVGSEPASHIHRDVVRHLIQTESSQMVMMRRRMMLMSRRLHYQRRQSRAHRETVPTGSGRQFDAGRIAQTGSSMRPETT